MRRVPPNACQLKRPNMRHLQRVTLQLHHHSLSQVYPPYHPTIQIRLRVLLIYRHVLSHKLLRHLHCLICLLSHRHALRHKLLQCPLLCLSRTHLILVCKLSGGERLKILESTWKAPEGFQWPYSERMDGGKLRRKYLGPQHLSGVYSVFSYSLSKRGLFCRPCVIFAPNDVRGVKLGRLVQSPKFAHLTGRDGYLTSHLSTKFHEDSISRAQALKQTTTSKAGDVAQQMKSSAALQRVKYRSALQRIVLCVAGVDLGIFVTSFRTPKA